MALKRYALPLLAGLVAVAYWPFWDGGATTPRWMVLAIGVLLLWGTPIRMTAIHWLGLALLGYAALSGLWSPQVWDWGRDLWYFIVLGGIFCLAAEQDDLRPTYTVFAAGVALSGFLAVAELRGWISLPNLNHPAALFGNKNYLAEAALPAFILLLPQWHRRWAWPLLLGCGLAIVLPESRGVLLALDIVLVVYLLRCYALAGAALLLVTVLAGWLVLSEPSNPAENYVNTVQLRLVVAWTTLLHLTFFGHGLGSFFTEYPTWLPHVSIVATRPAHPHNEVVDVLSDLGLPGLCLVAALAALVLRRSAGAVRLACIALGVIALSSFPLHLPATGFVAALLAGAAVAEHRRVLSQQRDRREPLYGGVARRRPGRPGAGAWDVEDGRADLPVSG